MAKNTENSKPCAECSDVRKVANLQSKPATNAEVKKVAGDWAKAPCQSHDGNTAINR